MNRQYIFAIICTTTILTSCGDEFLTIYPTDKDSRNEYYQTEEQIFKALVGAYDPLQWTDYYGGYNQFQFMSDLRSDDMFVGGDFGSYTFHHEMENFKMTAVDAPRSLWECFYIGVNRTNTIIEKIQGVEMDQAIKDRYLSEAYFLRAWNYHWLWKFWGNIPYYEKTLTAPYLAKQMSADSVYVHILSDLDHALEKNEDGVYKLPKTVSSSELGRVTVWAAMMLRARVVMYQNDESRYEDVYKDMNAIRGSQIFALTRDYASMWDDEHEFVTEPDMNKTETIWEINHRSENGSWDWPQGGQGTIYPKFIGINGLSESDPDFQAGWGFGPIRKEVYDLYEEGDIRRDGGIINFVKRQTELAATGVNISYEPRADDTGYFNRKYTARKGYNDAAYDVELNFNNNIRVFRYSETLLNLAELALKLNKGVNVAQVHLNTVRQRAFGVSIDVSSPHYRIATAENILEERRLEFVGEGMRFWDLVRTHNTQVLTETNTVFSRTWNDNWKYLPIPSLEIDRTEGEYKLKQNEGY